ncbi:hypothetical protein POM88_002734 [Heracleum sosnowskyi]|uniref:Glutamate-1-semialdehyde aminotransferase n=1 Tax=Heracleum sosnowskyi TaxID=360622 RepID=A0AAD8NAU7_9APIA|nr:hypothetical protein POM88_002734 [Heracleum sosnowskyi]
MEDLEWQCLGLFMASRAGIKSSEIRRVVLALSLKFLEGPAIMIASSYASLPQGIGPLVFAKEYNVHPDILSIGRSMKLTKIKLRTRKVMKPMEKEMKKELMPGGVNSPVRAFKSVGVHPIVIDSVKGSHMWDINGNEYIDYVGSWGPAIIGHADDEVCYVLLASVS